MSEAHKTSKDVIYIDVDDEVTSIIDKVENAEHKVVALVLPKRAASLQSIVNMKLLKRSADSAEKNVVLITSEHALLPLAGAAGLHVAKNLQSAPEIPSAPHGAQPAAETTEEVPDEDTDKDLPAKYDYAKPIGALAAKHEAENPETIDLDDEDENPPAAAPKKPVSKVKVPNFDRFRMLLGLGGLGLLALIIFIILAIFVLPKATIAVHTTSEPVSANFTLKAADGASLDPTAGTLPAKLESTDQTGSQQVTATGQQNNGQKATGTATMSIKCSDVSGSPPTISAGTGVSNGSLTYIIQSDTPLTTASFTGGCHFSGSSNITAAGQGSKYNIGQSTLSIDQNKYPGVSASGSASGGTDNIVTVLSQSDVDGAKQKLTAGTNGDQFSKDFQKKLSDQGEFVLSSTLKTGDANINAAPAVGQPASTANVSIKITYTVLTVKKDDLKQIIEAKVQDKIDKKKQKLTGNFLNDANISVQSQSSPSSATLQINEDTTAVPIIDKASVKKLAEGKKSGDIQTALNAWPGVKSVDVKLSPFWVSKVPKKDSKVTVVLKADKTSANNLNGAP